MCGISGFITKNPTKLSIDQLKKMTDVIAHRGPDGEGHWLNDEGTVGLGHRRLSIIDLSQCGAQPMHYLERYSIVFNGEIYNYIEIRETLQKQGYTFRSSSDTEVLLALFDRDKENCLQLLDGMFSMAIYDNKTKKVFCARDRFGEKPFYYSYKQGEYFMFGSEMKCLWAGGVKKEVEERMMFNYLCYGFNNDPNELSTTFYKNCTLLPHSHYLWIDTNTMTIDIHKYYDINYREINYNIGEKEATDTFYDLMQTAVQRRLRSDVAVGSSLSGGLDSSIIVSMINKLNPEADQKTFSAVFPGFKKDERKYMDYVIGRTKADAYFISPSGENLVNDIAKLVHHQEEPFGSASIYAQYCVMKLAKENNVTVMLDGQGADEILAGYHHYYVHFFNELEKTNPSLHKAEKEAYFNMHAQGGINPIVTKGLKYWLRKTAGNYTNDLKVLNLRFKELKNPVFNKDYFNANVGQLIRTNFEITSLNQGLYHNTLHSGLQELLRYADRNSMAHGREVRLPFLSHELVDFVFTLPSTLKIKDSWTKYIARKAFDPIMPKEISWRTDKIGYEPPQKAWLENKQVKEFTNHKMELLIKHGIFNKKTLEKGLLGNKKDEMAATQWRYFMAGSLLDE